MLRRTPNISALVGMVILLLVCITAWTTHDSKVGFSTTFSDVSLGFSRDSRGSPGQTSSQKILAQAAPRITLTETSTTLGDIQNATLGVSKYLSD